MISTGTDKNFPVPAEIIEALSVDKLGTDGDGK